LNQLLEDHSIRLARNTGWLAAGGVVSALLAVAQTALVARGLGSASFGALALAVALTGLVLQFADFRTWEVVVRLVPSSLKGAADGGGWMTAGGDLLSGWGAAGVRSASLGSGT
jgi:hypothetical protein